MRGLNPAYLERLEPGQRKWILEKDGKMFFDHFIAEKGYHLYIVGNTGSGKTQKGYWTVNWLKYTETQIWISTGKNDEILPLLALGLPVRVIIPKGCDVRFEERDPVERVWREIPNHPEVVHVPDAGSAWWAVKPGCINIFEFRNSFWSKDKLGDWMGKLFETLAIWTRLHRMPHIFPFSLYLDEAQRVIAGTRISTDRRRARNAEIVTENALEIRGAGGRLVFFAQSYKNLVPASRENLLCTLVCRGAVVDPKANPQLAKHCTGHCGRLPSTFKPNEGKFVYADGRSSPWFIPWSFPLYPRLESDRAWLRSVRVIYTGFFDLSKQETDALLSCIGAAGPEHAPI